MHIKPDGLVAVQWERARFHVCNPAGGMRMIGCICSRLSSDINVFVIKKKQKKAQGFVGMGAFIWEDNIAGRIFPYGTINRYIEKVLQGKLVFFPYGNGGMDSED